MTRAGEADARSIRDAATRPANQLAIAAVSDMLDIPIPTIRSWERRYGFPAPARTRGRHRRYSIQDVEQLRTLRDTITLGYAAGEAVVIVRAGPVHVPARRPAIDALLKSAMDLDPTTARSVLHEATTTLGVEPTIVEVALPALQEVGSRWKVGACDAANEHVMTDTVRAWFARLATLAPPPTRQHPIVLSCGPKELHSAGLEAFGVIIARRGWPTLTLGALTPVQALRGTVVKSAAAAAVVVAQRGVNRRSTIESLEAIHGFLGRSTFYAGGAFATPTSRRDVPGTYLGTDLVEAASIVEAVTHQSGRSTIGAG